MGWQEVSVGADFEGQVLRIQIGIFLLCREAFQGLMIRRTSSLKVKLPEKACNEARRACEVHR